MSWPEFRSLDFVEEEFSKYLYYRIVEDRINYVRLDRGWWDPSLHYELAARLKYKAFGIRWDLIFEDIAFGIYLETWRDVSFHYYREIEKSGSPELRPVQD